MLHSPDDPLADLSVLDVVSAAKLLVRFHWNSVTKFLAKKCPASLSLVKIRTVKKNAGLHFQSHKYNLVPFCTFFVRVIQNVIQDMSRRIYAVTFRDKWCNERHALLKDVNWFLRVFSHFLSDQGDIRNSRSAHSAVSFVQTGAGKAVLLLWEHMELTVVWWHRMTFRRAQKAVVTSAYCVTRCTDHCHYWSSTELMCRDHIDKAHSLCSFARSCVLGKCKATAQYVRFDLQSQQFLI